VAGGRQRRNRVTRGQTECSERRQQGRPQHSSIVLSRAQNGSGVEQPWQRQALTVPGDEKMVQGRDGRVGVVTVRSARNGPAGARLADDGMRARDAANWSGLEVLAGESRSRPRR
jgi:hypothetical protein